MYKKMKIFSASIALGLGLFCIPNITMAAFNDVSLTTAVSFPVGGYTVNISGSTAAVESITVGSTSFTVAMQSGSSITLSSPNAGSFSASTNSNVTQTASCGTASSLTLSATGVASITVTPSSGSCGGGGSVASVAFLGNASSQVSAPTPAIPNTPPTPTPVPSTKFIFTRNLQLNMKHSDVLQLQKYLNAQGFTIALSGPGSPGNETNLFGRLTYNAVVKFQNAYSTEVLKPSGLKKGTGYFGPATRAFVNK